MSAIVVPEGVRHRIQPLGEVFDQRKHVQWQPFKRGDGRLDPGMGFI